MASATIKRTCHFFYGSPSGGLSEPCAAPSGKVTELLAVLVGEIYPFIQLGGLEQ